MYWGRCGYDTGRFSMMRGAPAVERLMSRINLYKAILFATFCILQVLDVITTNRVLANGGWEANPFQIWSMAHFGSYWPIPKFALMALCAIWMVRWNTKSVAPLVGFVGVVVANNVLWAYA
jgi:hypothetical protein